MNATEDWMAGLARAKITPDEPMPLAGYAHRKDNWETISSDLFLKAMAFQDSGGARAVLITADLIGFTGQIAEKICRRIEEWTGLERASILLNGSHTHSGPLALLFPDPSDEPSREVVARYVERLVDTAVEAAVEALGGLRPARLSWGVGVATFVMNRREFTEGGVKLGFNPRGLADRSAMVLRVDDPEGRPRAVLFGAAGHNVTNSHKSLSIDGDYAGYAQAYVEKQYPGVQAMFMLGCAGDANIYPKGARQLAETHGAELGAEVCRVMEGRLRPIGGPLRAALERVDLPLQSFASREEIETMAQGAPLYRRFFTDRAIAMLDKGEPLPTHYNAPFAMWRFGDDLTLVGLCGETLADYVPLAEKVLGPLRLWVAGYCNDLFGYLPSPHVIEEGGYETRGLYTGVGLFTPEVYEIVGEAIKRLADAIMEDANGAAG